MTAFLWSGMTLNSLEFIETDYMRVYTAELIFCTVGLILFPDFSIRHPGRLEFESCIPFLLRPIRSSVRHNGGA